MRSFTLRLPSIGLRLLIALFIAVFLPLLVFAYLSFQGASEVSQRNFEAYLVETGLRRQQAISANFDQAVTSINQFQMTATNQELLLNAFVFRDLINVPPRLRLGLLNTGSDLFASAWLMSRRGTVLSDAAAEGQVLPYTNPDLRQSPLFITAQSLEEQGQNQALAIIEDATTTQAFVINAVRDADGATVGYLVITLNLETLVYRHLEDAASLGAYSFLIAPSGSLVIAPPRVLADDVIALDTLGVQRARSRSSSTLDIYTVTTASGTREVLGYHTHLRVLDNEFFLLTEITRSTVVTQILTYLQAISFPLVVGGLGLLFVLGLLLNATLTPPLVELTQAARAMIRGIFDVPVRSNQRADEIGQLAQAFVDMRAQVSTLTANTERRLRDRDRDIRVTQEISRAIVNERDSQRLMNTAVDLIVSSFAGIYHAQIYLVDAANDALLRASTGEAGRALLERGHRMRVGSLSLIGQVIEQGQMLVTRDIATSDVHRRNEFLPETQSELAIPLQVGSRVFGALDVQSKTRNAFDDDLITILTTLAGQISIALENARLYEESQTQLARISEEERRTTRRDWQTYMHTTRRQTLVEQAGHTTGYDFTALRRAATASKRAVVGDLTPRRTVPFVVPLLFRGEPLGMVEYELPEAEFRYDKVLLAEELVNRLAVSLDNARLFQESQRAAERERTVNEISARLTGQTDIQEIIETVLREVGSALRTPQVALRLHWQALAPAANSQTADQNGHESSQGQG